MNYDGWLWPDATLCYEIDYAEYGKYQCVVLAVFLRVDLRRLRAID